LLLRILVASLARTVVRTLIGALIHPRLHSVPRAFACRRIRSPAHYQRVHGCVLFGKEGIEPIHVPAKILRSLGRAGHE
jgi:hypothetical protein